MTEPPRVIITPPSAPQETAIAQAARIIESGGVVVIPTFCLYGLAADAFNPLAVQKVFDLKNRPHSNPVLIFVKSPDSLNGLVKEIPPAARKIMDRFWPGKVTLVFHAHNHLPESLTAGTGKIGIRIPDHPVTSALVRALDCPITGTSANISGEHGCESITALPPSIFNRAELILDAGPLQGGPGSTVIDVTCNPIRIIREGVVPALEIFKTLA